MSTMGIRTAITNERGVALPMALITLVLLTTLMLAFAVLSQTEPVIAANQLRVTQARALAESGFEYAVWALTNSTNPAGLGSPLASPVPAPFNGATFTTLGGTGGFTVSVANGPDADSRTITSVGWTPTNDALDTKTKAHRRITATVTVIPNLAGTAPCALCVKGALNVTANATINGANTDTACGNNDKYGAFTKDGTTNVGAISGGTDPDTGTLRSYAQNQDASNFNGFTFSNTALDALRGLAKQNGTYFGPGYSGATDSSGRAVAGTYTGSVTFNGSNKVKSGVVFVDTTDGANLDPNGTDTATLPTVTINDGGGSAFVDTSFTGYLIVNGSLVITGGMTIQGLVYALNDFTYSASGGGITGLVISQNIRDSAATSIDTSAGGSSSITFNCQYASAPNLFSHRFKLVPGTYREQSD